MNYPILFSILSLILISRLRFTLRDGPITKKADFARITLIPLVILPVLQFSIGWALLLLYLLLRPLIVTFLEKERDKLTRNRMIALVIDLLAVGLLCSPLFSMHTAGWVTGFEELFISIFYPSHITADLNWQAVLALLFGFLVILNEINLLIRYVLEKLKLAPLSNQHQGRIDEKQFRTGRVIGFLERIFVFLFMLMGQFTAIGFILAAKGVVRYPEFGNRSFAEYILIGTLLSVLMAMGAAFIIMPFI